MHKDAHNIIDGADVQPVTHDPDVAAALELFDESIKNPSLATDAAAQIAVAEFLTSLEGGEAIIRDLWSRIHAIGDTLPVLYEALKPYAPEQSMASEEPMLELSNSEILSRFHEQGFVDFTPKLRDTAADPERSKAILTYSDSSGKDGTISEQHALQELVGYLEDFIDKRTGRRNNTTVYRDVAQSILNKLTFIGSKEFTIGTEGLATRIIDLLTSDSSLQVCLLPATSLLPDKAEGMSAQLVHDAVIEHIANTAPEVMDRLKQSLPGITSYPKQTKVILVDDWVVSGRQMRRSIDNLVPKLRVQPQYPLSISNVEINVLTAPSEIIKSGLCLDSEWCRSSPKYMRVPTIAYYRAHPTRKEYSENIGAHISGSHSTVNFGFSMMLQAMERYVEQTRQTSASSYPKLGQLVTKKP